MIEIKGECVKIDGELNELRDELVNLHVAIMQDPGLMEISAVAMKLAVIVAEEKRFTITDVKSFKVGDNDRTDEIKIKYGDLHENDKG